MKAFSRMFQAFFRVREGRIAVGAIAREGAMIPEDPSPSWIARSKSLWRIILACKLDDSGSLGTVAPKSTPGKLDFYGVLLQN